MSTIIKALLPTGHLPSTARAEVVSIAREYGTPAGSLPVFATIEEAQAYEADHPGHTALYLTAASTTSPPAAAGTAADYTWRWVATDYDSAGWMDTTGKVKLTPVGGGVVPSVSGDAVTFFKNSQGVRATTAGIAGQKTLVVVASTTNSTTSLSGIVGDPNGPHQVVMPGGAGSKSGWYSKGADGSIKAANSAVRADTARHITTVRIDGASSTLTVDGTTITATSGDPTFTTFQIGGALYGGNVYGDTSVCEVRVYSRRLTDSEVSALHKELGGKYGVAI